MGKTKKNKKISALALRRLNKQKRKKRAETLSAAEETAAEPVVEVPQTAELAVEAPATTERVVEAAPTAERVVRAPPTTELAVETPDAAQQQATAQPEAAVEAPKPLPRLRQRDPPPPPTRKRGKNLRSAVVMSDKERLAGLVRGHPVLYNRDYAHYGDRTHAHYAWAYISRRMMRTESECISMWKRLKDRYRAAITRQKRTSEQGLRVKPSQYDNYMAFMKPYLYMWKKITAADEAPAPPPPPARAPERPPRPPRNTLVELFRNLGETVKAFPEDMKNRVKSEVHKIVSDARKLVLRNNSVEQLFIVEGVGDIKEEPIEVLQT